MPILTAKERIGTEVGGRYVPTRIIGEGGFGAVFQARHTITGREVALKLLHAHLVQAEQVAQRFLIEAQAMAKIRHPGIVQVLDAGREPDGTIFLALELLEGETLEDRLQRESKFARDEAIKITLEVLGALSAAHARDIVHRDIKPANIFMSKEPDGIVRPKLLDFGIAQIVPEGAAKQKGKLTGAGVILGTPEYMPPEQARAVGTIGPVADLWSVGICLYEMLSGVVPWTSDSAMAVLISVANAPLPDIRAFVPDIPEDLVTVIRTALEKDPTKRFANADAMRAALEATLASATKKAVTPTGHEMSIPPVLADPSRADDALKSAGRAPTARFRKEFEFELDANADSDSLDLDPSAEAAVRGASMRPPASASASMRAPPMELPIPTRSPSIAPVEGTGRFRAPSQTNLAAVRPRTPSRTDLPAMAPPDVSARPRAPSQTNLAAVRPRTPSRTDLPAAAMPEPRTASQPSMPAMSRTASRPSMPAARPRSEAPPPIDLPLPPEPVAAPAQRPAPPRNNAMLLRVGAPVLAAVVIGSVAFALRGHGSTAPATTRASTDDAPNAPVHDPPNAPAHDPPSAPAGQLAPRFTIAVPFNTDEDGKRTFAAHAVIGPQRVGHALRTIGTCVRDQVDLYGGGDGIAIGSMQAPIACDAHDIVLVPDLDGDGQDDPVAVTRDRQALAVLSSRTLGVLRTIPLLGAHALGGAFLSANESVIIAQTEPNGPDGATEIVALSLRNGQVLWRTPGVMPLLRLGQPNDLGLSIGPDATGDGVPDVLAGATVPATLPPDRVPARPRCVELLSGANGQRVWHDPVCFARGGSQSVSLGADVDGDHRADAVVGTDVVRGSEPHVVIVSGGDGHIIRRLATPSGPASSGFGAPVVLGPDLNGDGVGDIIVGSVWSGGTFVTVFSGHDGAALATHRVAGDVPFGSFEIDAGDGLVRGGMNAILVASPDQGITVLGMVDPTVGS